jgi:uncharacterized protein YjiS (DUF1127 family)
VRLRPTIIHFHDEFVLGINQALECESTSSSRKEKIMINTSCSHIAARRRRFPILGWVMAAMSVARQRHKLKALDPHLLDDIGLSRDAAAAEAARPIWDVPPHWLK